MGLRLSFLILCIFASCFSEEESKNSFFDSSLTDAEKVGLEVTLRHLFTFHEFAYTLFFDKPASFSFLPAPTVDIFPYERLYFLGEDVEFVSIPLLNPGIALSIEPWKKIKSNLHIPKYLFLEDDTSFGEETIFFINKKAFLEVVNLNLNIFKRELGSGITAQELLRQIESREKNVMTALKFNEELLGIILGYGQHNASLFKRRNYLIHLKNGIFLDEAEQINNKLDYFERKLTFEPHFSMDILGSFFLSVVMPVSFACDKDHKPTRELIKKYHAQRSKLTKIYTREDWLKIVLAKLTSNE